MRRADGWRAALSVVMLSVAMTTQGVAQEKAKDVSLKNTQRAIRERLMTEAGPADVIYARVDFNECALTIQTRTPKRDDGAETRITWSVHGTSLDNAATGAKTGDFYPVTVSVREGSNAVRVVTQSIAHGKVTESITTASALTFSFAREATATSFADAFRQLVRICHATPFAN